MMPKVKVTLIGLEKVNFNSYELLIKARLTTIDGLDQDKFEIVNGGKHPEGPGHMGIEYEIDDDLETRDSLVRFFHSFSV